jgi:uncharacterized protein (TIGR00251 family)
MPFLISIKAIPNAKKVEIIDNGFDDLGRQNFKAKVNQPPEDGKANQAIIQLVSDYFKVKKNAVKIINGELSRNKIIEINHDKKLS